MGKLKGLAYKNQDPYIKQLMLSYIENWNNRSYFESIKKEYIGYMDKHESDEDNRIDGEQYTAILCLADDLPIACALALNDSGSKQEVRNILRKISTCGPKTKIKYICGTPTNFVGRYRNGMELRIAVPTPVNEYERYIVIKYLRCLMGREQLR